MSQRRIVLASLLGPAGAGALLLFAGIPFYVRNVPDDGYYYLVVARNLAEGLGPTFDGITRTSGFHPLLAFLLAGIYSAVPFSFLGDLRIALVLGIGFHVLAGWILYRALEQTGRREHAWLGALLYWINPYALLRCLNAMESSLYALCLTLLLYLLLRFGPRLRRPEGNGWIPAVTGLALGATLLARTDAIFLAPLLGWFFLPRRLPPSGAAWRSAACFLLPVAACILPWVWFSERNFGTVWQYSGLVKVQARWDSFSDATVLEISREAVANFWVWIRKTLLTAPLTKYLILVSLICRDRGKHLAAWLGSFPAPVWLYLVFTLAVGAYYALSYDQIRGWYLVPSSVLMSYLSIHGLRHLAPARRGWKSPFFRYAVFSLLLLESVGYATHKLARGIHREQRYTYEMVRWAGRHLEPGVRVGCFNAGIPAFFLENPVINLDGLMNNEILEVNRTRRMGEYLHEKRVAYLLDHAGVLEAVRDRSRPMWAREHLRTVHTLPGKTPERPMVLWKVGGRRESGPEASSPAPGDPGGSRSP